MATIVALPTVPMQWLELELELILRGLLQTETCAREGVEVACASLRPAEMLMHASMRPTEAACFRVQKYANNHQLIVAGFQMFLRHACAAHFRIV